MQLLVDILSESWKILLEASPYVLFGFFVAGLLKAFVPSSLVAKHLGHGRFGPVFKAALFGIPLPLCSCGVIPAAAGLRQQGASKGATTSFLIATPETGVDSMAVTWALLDPVMTVMRPLAALLTSVTAGLLVDLFPSRSAAVTGDGTASGTAEAAGEPAQAVASTSAGLSAAPVLPVLSVRAGSQGCSCASGAACQPEDTVLKPGAERAATASHCASCPPALSVDVPAAVLAGPLAPVAGNRGACQCGTDGMHDKALSSSGVMASPATTDALPCCGDHHARGTAISTPVHGAGGAGCCSSAGKTKEPSSAGGFAGMFARFCEGMRFAFGELVADIGGWLLLGVVLASLITVFLPDDLFSGSFASGIGGIIVMMAIGIPLYVCATASTPIAAAFALKGISPGAALVFLLAGPATNVATITVVARLLGRRAATIYVAVIGVMSVLLGLAVNLVYGWLGLGVSGWVQGTADAAPGILSLVAALVLLVLVFRQWVPQGLARLRGEVHATGCGCGH